ncbi:glutaredoxin-2 [Encephalitozoon cuniculi]|nr:glutaredoxin-2 [Encephalitozoon cuniculi]
MLLYLGIMKSLCLFSLIVFTVSMGVVHMKEMDITGQKAVGFGVAKRTNGLVTNTAHEKLQDPGITVVLERNCRRSEELENSLRKLGLPYRPFYVDDDLDLYNRMVTENSGEIPSMYKDGKKIENPVKFLEAYKAQHMEINDSK